MLTARGCVSLPTLTIKRLLDGVHAAELGYWAHDIIQEKGMMRFTLLLLAVACTASALRIPSAVRPPTFDLARLVHDQQKQVLELKCEECSGLVPEEERHDEYSLVCIADDPD